MPMVVSDRKYEAIKVAKSFGIDTHILLATTGSKLSDKLVRYFKE